MKVLLNRKIILFVFVLVTIVFLYFGAKGTYTSYESNVEAKTGNTVSQLKLSINGVDLGSDEIIDNRILIENVTWTSSHTRAGKISPGSTGQFNFELDPTESDVAILYEFQLIDKTVDPDKLLTFNSVTSNRSIVRTAVDTYSGIISLSDINNELTTNVTIGFVYTDTEDVEGYTGSNDDLEDFFEIHFRALQYKGETLVPYTG